MAGAMGLFGGGETIGSRLTGMAPSDLGILGASLKDALAYWSGRPQDANSLTPALSHADQMRQTQGLLAALNSPDPAVRQQAYGAYTAMGGDAKPFQQQAAANATPDLLKNLQPGQITAPGGSFKLDNGSTLNLDPVSANREAFSLPDALQMTGSPELQAQMAPEVIKDMIARQDKAVTTLPPEDVAAMGFRPGTIVQKDAYGNLKVAQASDLKSPERVAQDHQIDLSKPNPNSAFNNDGTPNKAFQAYEEKKLKAQQAPAWANVEIARQAASQRAAGGFTPEEGALMGALAERGVSLPTGFRSKEQQKTLYQGILARNPGKSPDEIADLIKKGSIELGAQKKETQTAASVAGKVEVFQNEIEEFAPLVREALAKVPRGRFVPLNRLLQMGDTSISDPNLKVLKGRINALLNAYDGLASRGGTDVDKRAEARALLTSADGPEAANAQLDSFLAEAAAAHRAAVKATKVPELAPANSTSEPKKPPPVPGRLPGQNKGAQKIRTYNPATGRLE